jgi:cation diffusion facilitator family transporter
MTTDSGQLDHKALQEKRNVALSSVLAAVFLTGLKIIIGLVTGSLGILSEAAHSGLDLVAAIVTFFAVKYSSHPPDEVHTYGHGKVENLSALFETLLLLVTCVWIIYEAFQRLFFKSVEVEASIWGFLVMAVSIIVDFTRSRALARVAKKFDSQALEADALHFSTDIWSSSVVIAGLALVGLSRWLGIVWLAKADAVAAMGVAGIVIYVSVQLGKKTVADLLDAVPPGVRSEVVEAVQRLPEVKEVRQTRIRKSGPEVFADMTLMVSRDTALEHAHEIASRAEAAVQAVLPGVDMMINVVPDSSETAGTLTHVRLLAARSGMGAHGIRIYNVAGSQSLDLHLEIDESLSLEEAHARADGFEAEVYRTLPEIQRVITHIEPSGEHSSSRQVEASMETISSDERRVRQVLENLSLENGFACEPYNLRVYRDGQELVISFGCFLEAGMALTEAHAWTEKVEKGLRTRLPSIGRVVIHVEPDQPIA